MPGNERDTFFESLLWVTTQDLRRRAEDTAFRHLEGLLGIVVGNGFRFALGPLGFVVPVDKVLAWGARIGYEAFRDWQTRKRAIGTLYEIRTTTDGFLTAKNTDISGLLRMPLQLPQAAHFPLRQLLGQKPPLARWPQLSRVDGARVFHDLWAINRRVACPQCGQRVSALGSVQLGHSLRCPKNNFRPLRESMAPPAATPGAVERRANPRTVRCPRCARILLSLGGQIIGHAFSCSLNAERLRPPTMRAERLFQGPSTLQTKQQEDNARRAAMAWRYSPMNPANPYSPLNPNNPMNPNSPRHPANLLNPANPNSLFNIHRRR